MSLYTQTTVAHVSFAYIFVNYASILFQHQYTLLPNMSKKSAALEAKFEIAVKILLKAPNLTVQEAMIVAKFSTKYAENYNETHSRRQESNGCIAPSCLGTIDTTIKQ